jgi:ankyrin repeat protein
MEELKQNIEKVGNVDQLLPYYKNTTVEVTPLYLASAYNNLEAVKYLFLKGANINYELSNYIPSTPLTKAIISGHNEIAKYLLNQGAKLDIKKIINETYNLKSWKALLFIFAIPNQSFFHSLMSTLITKNYFSILNWSMKELEGDPQLEKIISWIFANN